MKIFTKIFPIFLLFFSMGHAYTQGVSTYSFSSSAGTYTPITGGTNYTSTATSSIDITSYSPLSIGFSFTYGGVSFSQFGISSDGYIILGSGSPGNNYTALNGVNNAIAGLNNDILGRLHCTGSGAASSPIITITAGNPAITQVGDLVSGTGVTAGSTIVSISGSFITLSANCTTGGTGRDYRFSRPGTGIRYETIGTSPNRKLVVQWSDFCRYSTSGGISVSDAFSFQIILSETTNTIDVVYNIPSATTIVNTNILSRVQVGLRGQSSADVNIRSVSSTETWATSVAGTGTTARSDLNATNLPSTGLTYTWIPPSCTGPAFAATTNDFSGCPTTYAISYNITSLGTATSYNVTNSLGYTCTPATVTSVPTAVVVSGIPAGTPSGITSFIHNNSTICNATQGNVTISCPPVNDDCSASISLTPSTTCSYATYTNAGATASGGAPTISCSSYSGGDVWFSVVVPAAGNLTIDTQTGVITDGGMAVYSGSCGSLIQIACDDDSSPNGLMPMIILSGRTPGETLYIRMFEYGNDNNGTFGICVRGSSCAGPGFAASTNDFSGCPTTYAISYNITSLGTATSYNVTNSLGYTCTPSTVTSVPTSVVVSGIPVGTASGITTFEHNNSSICNSTSTNVTLACPPPNDLCANAIVMGPGLNETASGNNAGATNDPAAGYNCTNFGTIGKQVWYSFDFNEASPMDHTVSTCGSAYDTAISVYYGTCTSLTFVACNDDFGGSCGNRSQLTFTASNNPFQGGDVLQERSIRTYYIQVGSYDNISSPGGAFTLNVYRPLILPITLAEFKGKTNGKINTLQWKTSSEKNMDYFELERSFNGTDNWESIEKVASFGNTTETKQYGSNDKNPFKLSYYRLRMVELDGKISYSKIITLENNDISKSVIVFPNPTKGKITVGGLTNGTQRAVLFNNLGQRMDISILDNQVDLSEMTNGIYYLQIAESAQIFRIVKD